MALHLFGLTGGIGSGKSSVGRRFAARGVPVIDADQLAREAVAPGSEGLGAIVGRFGREFLDETGALDRKKLAARVFHDDEARRALNAITHPIVARLSIERTAALDAAGEKLACYEVPLLFESGMHAYLRPVVVVAAPVEAQVQRAALRDGVPPEDVEARIRAQMPLADKVARADHVVENDGTLAQLIDRADEVLDRICAGLGIDPAEYPRPA